MRKILIFAALMAGLGVLASTPEARRSFRAFEQRAMEGDPEARYRLATILETGWDSVPADSARALSLMRLSAEQGYPAAMNYMGYLYGTGYSAGGNELLKANRDSTIYWLRRSADTGDPKAMSNLAFLLLNPGSDAANSDETEKNDSIAWGYLQRATERGVPTAYSMTGDMLRDGRYVKADTLEAARNYEAALSLGLTDAESRLISMMARRWEKMPRDEAFDLGARYYDTYAPAAGTLLMRFAGRMPQFNEGQIVMTEEFADSLSHELDLIADAMNVLGEAASLGKGIPYNHGKSLEYYVLSAVAGNDNALEVINETLGMFPDSLKDLPESTRESARTLAVLATIIGRPIPDFGELYAVPDRKNGQ